jgi:hypothetical protein
MATRKTKAVKKKARGRSAKNSRKTKGTWGGARPGAGRPRGSGRGPSPDSRRNRVAVMFSDDELRELKKLARAEKKPLSTTAYAIIEKRLRRKA